MSKCVAKAVAVLFLWYRGLLKDVLSKPYLVHRSRRRDMYAFGFVSRLKRLLLLEKKGK